MEYLTGTQGREPNKVCVMIHVKETCKQKKYKMGNQIRYLNIIQCKLVIWRYTDSIPLYYRFYKLWNCFDLNVIVSLSSLFSNQGDDGLWRQWHHQVLPQCDPKIRDKSTGAWSPEHCGLSAAAGDEGELLQSRSGTVPSIHLLNLRISAPLLFLASNKFV